MGVIRRITLFKIAENKQEQLKEAYEVLRKDEKKDGHPYIIGLNAGPTIEDQRSQGYTFVAQSTFKTLDDMKYYDNECEAHKALKAEASKLGVDGTLTVYFEDKTHEEHKH